MNLPFLITFEQVATVDHHSFCDINGLGMHIN